MRKRIIIGNWKMNTTLADAMVLTESIKHGLEGLEGEMNGEGGIEVVLCPPYPWLYPVKEELSYGSPRFIHLGAQNVYTEEEGAYTGEVSIRMLKPLVSYVIAGHSERRYKIIPGEDNETINKKLRLILNYGLSPILCLGERVKQVKRGRGRPRLEHGQDIVEQLKEGLKGVPVQDISKLIIAYEPVWAIGTGDAASPDYANEQIDRLRRSLADDYGSEVAQKIRLVYGGSTDADNASDYMSKSEIDGLLPGGSSLKASEFILMCKIVSQRQKKQRKSVEVPIKLVTG